nr:unnamed protein product [Callosobruchus analis]
MTLKCVSILKHPIINLVFEKIQNLSIILPFLTGKRKFAKNQHQVVSEKTGRKTFSCYSCNYTVYSKRQLNKHMQVHENQTFAPSIGRRHSNVQASTSSDLYECKICPYKSSSEDDHLKHMKIYECSRCTYKTIMKYNFNRHLSVHAEIASNYQRSLCIHCNVTLNSKITLDDHVVRKHPDLAASVRRKIYECSECNYKTVIKAYLDKHKSTHCDTGSGYECAHCKGTFKSKRGLDNHVVKRHPNVTPSVDKKVYECTACVYKTTLKHNFERHVWTHPETSSRCKLSRCIHCNASFKSARALDNHVVTKHPEVATSVGRQIFQCAECDYKTAVKNYLDKHVLLKHSELGLSYKLRTCVHCNATFKGKEALDDHVVKKHPDFITSVTHKIYECTECAYKTTKKNNFERHLKIHQCPVCFHKTAIKSSFDRHMLTHQENAPSSELSRCPHCDTTFKKKSSTPKSKLPRNQQVVNKKAGRFPKRKRTLENHVIGKHPNLLAPASKELFSCANCDYKATKKLLANHMLTHSDTLSNHERVAKRHPDFVKSPARKLYDCSECGYKAYTKPALKKHMLEHSEGTKKVHECKMCSYKTLIKYHLVKHIASIHHLELMPCVHCNTTFKTKTLLDDHIVKIHPDYITSVTSKLHECSKCTYKTTIKKYYNKHILVHPETASCYNVFRCSHCDVTFRRKESLDDHVLKNHPDFFTSHTKKIYECADCGFKTTMKKNFYRHISSSVHRKAK